MSDQLDEERVQQFARKHVRHEGSRSNTTLPSEELQSLATELLELRAAVKTMREAIGNVQGGIALYLSDQFRKKTCAHAEVFIELCGERLIAALTGAHKDMTGGES